MVEIRVQDPPIRDLYPDDKPFPNFLHHILHGMKVRKPILYAWGDVIFNPRGAMIPPELMIHEAVHQKQQGDDPEAWWRRYIEDERFRLAQEIPAHQAECRHLMDKLKDRNARYDAIHRIALRLSSPLYGSLMDYDHAKAAITSLDPPAPGYRDDPEAQIKKQRFRVSSP